MARNGKQRPTRPRIEVRQAAAGPEEAAAIAAAIERLIDDADFRHQLAAKGLARASMFDWHETARQTLDIYKQVVRGPLPVMAERHREGLAS